MEHRTRRQRLLLLGLLISWGMMSAYWLLVILSNRHLTKYCWN